MKATTQAILSTLANADKGEVSGLPLWNELYSEDSVRFAAEAFSDYCRVARVASKDGDLIAISVHPSAAANGSNVIGSFLNFLLSHSLQARWQKVQADD